MAESVNIGTMIVSSPNIREGRPRIAGTGVTVHRIANWYKMGLEPEEIVREIPHLTLAQVFAALTYYHANRDQIEADLAAEEAEVEAIERAHFAAVRSTA